MTPKEVTDALKLKQTRIGPAYATSEGLALLEASGMSKKLNYCQTLSERLQKDGDFLIRGNAPIQNLPGIADLTTFLGYGSEGFVYGLNAQHAVKIFHFFGNDESTGLSGFERLLLGAQQDLYDVPKVYLGTRRVLLMQNMSKYPDYFAFVKSYPAEAEILYEHIKSLAHLGTRRIDYGDISGIADTAEFPENGSSVLVRDFNPKKKDPFKRFRLVATDFC